MSDPNEMEVIAEAAYYVTDIVAGRPGTFKIEEEGWGNGDAERAYQEVRSILALLDDSGFKRDDERAMLAPFTANIRRAVYWKKFNKKKLWVTITLATRFGIDCEVRALFEEPW